MLPLLLLSMPAGSLSGCSRTIERPHDMGRLTIERLGGLAGFGGPNLQSRGEYAYSDLAVPDRAKVDALFAGRKRASVKPVADGFTYRISRKGARGTETVEVPEALVPQVLIASVVDGFR